MKIEGRNISVVFLILALLVFPLYAVSAVFGFLYYAMWRGFLSGFYYIMSREEARYGELLDEVEQEKKDPA